MAEAAERTDLLEFTGSLQILLQHMANSGSTAALEDAAELAQRLGERAQSVLTQLERYRQQRVSAEGSAADATAEAQRCARHARAAHSRRTASLPSCTRPAERVQ